MIDIAALLLGLSTTFSFLAIVIIVVGLLPIMIKEVRYYDGLWPIRWIFLGGAIFYLLMSILSFVSFLTNPKDVSDILKVVRSQVYFNALSLINSLGRFTFSLLLTLIYRWKYKEPYL